MQTYCLMQTFSLYTGLAEHRIGETASLQPLKQTVAILILQLLTEGINRHIQLYCEITQVSMSLTSIISHHCFG